MTINIEKTTPKNRKRMIALEFILTILVPVFTYIFADSMQFQKLVLIDKTFMSLIMLVICLIWFSYRRIREFQHDIIMRDCVETALDVSEKELKVYQFMVESAQDAIFFKDLESCYIVANSKTLEVFGLSREEVIGKNDYELMSNETEARKSIEDDRIVIETGEVKK